MIPTRSASKLNSAVDTSVIIPIPRIWPTSLLYINGNDCSI